MTIFSLSKFTAKAFSVTALLGLALVPMSSAIADEPAQAPILPTGDLRPEASADPFSTRGDNTSAIMGLIHRTMRGDSNVDRAAEAQSQRENINDATSEFFAKRNQLLKPKSAILPGSVPSVIAPMPTATAQPAPGTNVIVPDNLAPIATPIVPISP